jgi:hypothetical protein
MKLLLINRVYGVLNRDAPKVFEAKEGAEKFTFQAEVNRLMDIIIHSLYSNKVCIRLAQALGYLYYDITFG